MNLYNLNHKQNVGILEKSILKPLTTPLNLIILKRTNRIVQIHTNSHKTVLLVCNNSTTNSTEWLQEVVSDPSSYSIYFCDRSVPPGSLKFNITAYKQNYCLNLPASPVLALILQHRAPKRRRRMALTQQTQFLCCCEWATWAKQKDQSLSACFRVGSRGSEVTSAFVNGSQQAWF